MTYSDASARRWATRRPADRRRHAASHLARNLVEPAPHARADAGRAGASAAAVPRSTIANLESGDGNPSLVGAGQGRAARSACRSTSCSASPRAKVRRWPAAEVAMRVKGRGVTIRELVPEPVPDEMMEVMDFAPGAAMGGTPHLPGTREFFTCLDGRVNLMVAGERYALAAGDVLAFPRQPAALVPERRRAGAGARRLGRRLRQGRRLSRGRCVRRGSAILGSFAARPAPASSRLGRCQHLSVGPDPVFEMTHDIPSRLRLPRGAQLATLAFALLLLGCGREGGDAARPRRGRQGPGRRRWPAAGRSRRRSPCSRGRSAWSPSCRAGSRRRASRRCARAPPASCRSALFVEGSDVQGRPAAVPDRSRAATRPALASAQATLARAQANLTQASGAGRALQAAGRSQRDQQAGLRQRGRGAEDGRGRRRGGAGAAVQTAQINLGYAIGHGADLGPHRPRARHRRRARRPGRGDAARGDAADQSDVRQLHAVDDRGAAPAPRDRRAASSSAPAARRGAACAIVLEDGSVYPQPGRLLFSDLTRRPDLGPDHAARRGAEPERPAAAGHVRARAARAGRRRRRGIVVPQQAVQRGSTGDTRDGRRRRRQGRAAAGEGRRRAGRRVGHPRRPQGRRDGDGRRLPEAARRRAGEAGAVAAAGSARRAGGMPPASAAAAAASPRSAEAAPWRSSSSTGRSSRG